MGCNTFRPTGHPYVSRWYPRRGNGGARKSARHQTGEGITHDEHDPSLWPTKKRRCRRPRSPFCLPLTAYHGQNSDRHPRSSSRRGQRSPVGGQRD